MELREAVIQEVLSSTEKENVMEILITDIDGIPHVVREDGVLIAKRGKPGTPQAKTWISLEPGYVVYSDDAGELVVEESLIKKIH